jgi:transcriptional regulator with XRE-family HTH domain
VSADELEPSGFGQYLDGLLKLAKLSNADVDRMTGIHHSIIAKWRTSKTSPSMDRLRPLADALGIPRVIMFIRAGLMEAEDVNISQLALDIDEALARTPEPKRATMEAHLRFVLDGMHRGNDDRRTY